MHKSILSPLRAAALVLSFSLVGCAGFQRAGIDAVAAAGGAAVGHAIEPDSPVGAVAGAAGGLVLGELLNTGIDSQKAATYKEGYNKGRSDEVKTLYWAQRELHKANTEDSQLRRKIIEVPMNEQRTADGVIIEPRSHFVEVVE